MFGEFLKRRIIASIEAEQQLTQPVGGGTGQRVQNRVHQLHRQKRNQDTNKASDTTATYQFTKVVQTIPKKRAQRQIVRALRLFGSAQLRQLDRRQEQQRIVVVLRVLRLGLFPHVNSPPHNPTTNTYLIIIRRHSVKARIDNWLRPCLLVQNLLARVNQRFAAIQVGRQELHVRSLHRGQDVRGTVVGLVVQTVDMRGDERERLFGI